MLRISVNHNNKINIIQIEVGELKYPYDIGKFKYIVNLLI